MKKWLTKLADTSSPLRLAFLALLLLSLFFYRSPSALSPEEARLCERVRAAQNTLWSEMSKRGETDAENDLDRTGFIGLDWSPTTTTLGSLESKRNACDPLWAAQCLRWFDRLGLKAGDRIVILSSSSFPGMLYAVLAAAESRHLQIALSVSLGSSTWGANRPEAPWPALAHVLSEHGFLATRPLFYTLGGGGENGHGMFEEGVEALTRAAREDGVELFRSAQLSEIAERKLRLVDAADTEATLVPQAKLVVSIGGALSNMGESEAAITLRNGLLFPQDARDAGDGVIALALRRGVPVLHLLNLRSLADRVGIDFDARRSSFRERSVGVAATGVALFALFMITHKRWTWEENEK